MSRLMPSSRPSFPVPDREPDWEYYDELAKAKKLSLLTKAAESEAAKCLKLAIWLSEPSLGSSPRVEEKHRVAPSQHEEKHGPKSAEVRGLISHAEGLEKDKKALLDSNNLLAKELERANKLVSTLRAENKRLKDAMVSMLKD